MQNIATNTAARVSIKNGSYHEMLYLRGKNNITLAGESQANTLIHYDNSEGFNSGSGGSASSGGSAGGGRALFLVEGADMLSIENLTIHNQHIRASGSGDQAEAIYFNSSNRLIAKQAAFISEQDTLLLKGYNWFYNSLIAGNVDFIWGYSVASLFENSEIRSLGDSKAGANGSGGYILQARTRNITDPGFVFLNSRLTHAPGPTGATINNGATYLARSGGSSSYYDNVVFVNCRMDSHIASQGWNTSKASNPASPYASAGWREHGSMNLNGNALNLSSRVNGYLLSGSEVSPYDDRASVFSSYNNGSGWNPSP